jgi:hypothetical protein
VTRHLAALVVVAVLAGGCGDDGGAAVDSPALEATATRSTLFNTQRTFRLELENTGTATVPVTSIRLDSPLFEPVDAEVRDTTLAPGQRLLMPLPYGESRCDDQAPVDQVVVVEIAGDEVRVPLAQRPEGVVDDLHRAECTEASIRERVDVAFADDWTPTGPTVARGSIGLSPRQPGTEVDVSAVEGNVVFGIRIAGPETVEALPVEVSADRCDQHALIESKRTFIVRVVLSVDGEPAYPIDVEALGPSRDLFDSLLQACVDGQ